MREEKFWYIYDKKYDGWALEFGTKDKVRTLEQYRREKWFKKLKKN